MARKSWRSKLAQYPRCTRDMVGFWTSIMLVTLIADDLTGACDAGGPFAGRSRVGGFVAPASPGPGWRGAAGDTQSRGPAPAGAPGGGRGVAAGPRAGRARGRPAPSVAPPPPRPVG